MLLELFAVDQRFNKEKSFGRFSCKKFKIIIERSKEKGFECLSFISLDQCTFFNDCQAIKIIEEIAFFGDFHDVNPVVESIKSASNYILNDSYTYLLFKPIKG